MQNRAIRRPDSEAVQYTTLGSTGLRVSVAGLGCGGNSRLGLGSGKSAADAVSLVPVRTSRYSVPAISSAFAPTWRLSSSRRCRERTSTHSTGSAVNSPASGWYFRTLRPPR